MKKTKPKPIPRLCRQLTVLSFILYFSAFAAFGQRRITGVITDAEGEPLAGATVVVEGSTKGVSTDNKGAYAIEVNPTDKLTFGYLGMKSQTITVGSQTVINVQLAELPSELDEVTVVAFAKQKKESVIGAITTVNVKDLKVPSSNLTTSFAGRVAGLISYQTSGEPGQDNASFFIRGITTFGAAAKKDPLILIDGIELSSDDLARLNTDDIASFSIMKDATSTALYGARGANGVILVTTKEGREGKVKVNVRVENSFSSATEMIQLADPITYMKMHNEAILTRDRDGVQQYSQERIELTERGDYPVIYPQTDWYKTMFNDVISNQRANISLNGGGNIARYYVALNIAQDNGNIKVDHRNSFNNNINLTKYAIRTNININLTKTTELIFRLSSTFDDYNGPLDGGSSMYTKVIQANPVLFLPTYEPDAEYAYVKHILFGNYDQGQYLNPYAESLRGYNEYSNNTTNAQFGLNQKLDMLTEGLNVSAMVNMTRYSQLQATRTYSPFYYAIELYDLPTNTYTLRRLNTGDDKLTYGGLSQKVTTSLYFEGKLSYDKQLNETNSLNVLLVGIMMESEPGGSMLALPKRNLGLSGRLAYNYDSRYFAEFNFGYNGSERFAKQHRWGFFPSIGVAWMVSNEPFFGNLKEYVSNLKFKGTYGLVGNDQIGADADRFFYLSDVNMNAGKSVNWGLLFANNPGSFSVTRYANNNIGWEVAYKTNIGMELALKNGLSTIIDVFRERRENILINRVIPATMGILQTPQANLGVGSGKGIDIELNYEKSFNKDFFLNGRGTFTYATNEVLEWEEPDYSTTPWRSAVGYNSYQTKGYIAERLFVDEAEVKNSPTQFGNVMAGDIKYRDVNGDDKITELDMVPIGYPTQPEITYGFGLSGGYKGFDASFFFQGSARRSFWLDYNKLAPFMDPDGGSSGQTAVIKTIAESYWSESNRDPYAFWPRLSTYAISNNRQTSTYYMHDASFLRLKTVEFGYTLSEKLVAKARLSNLRIYLSGTNLLRWSAFKLWDPEMGGNGLGYPLQRVWNIGINLGI